MKELRRKVLSTLRYVAASDTPAERVVHWSTAAGSEHGIGNIAVMLMVAECHEFDMP